MNFNREEAINYIKSLSDTELAKLIARNGKFNCTVNNIKEAVDLKKQIFELGFFSNLQYYMIHSHKANRIE